jgi:hypothetical protein
MRPEKRAAHIGQMNRLLLAAVAAFTMATNAHAQTKTMKCWDINQTWVRSPHECFALLRQQQEAGQRALDQPPADEPAACAPYRMLLANGYYGLVSADAMHLLGCKGY